MVGLYTSRGPAHKPPRAVSGPRCYPPRVTRLRSSALGPHRPSRPRSHPIPAAVLPFLAVLALAAAACAGGSADGSPSGVVATDPAVPPSSGAVASEPAAPSTDDLELESEAAPTDSPGPTETPSSGPVGAAMDCTGTAENRTFYESVSVAVAWTVYCPVLPSGWYVDQGSYRLADGGRLVISYRGPGGAHITLSEGNWCTDGSGCPPGGADAGTAAFGDRDGALLADGGRYVIVVDPGSPVSWQLVSDGLDEATVRAFGAALIAVGG